MEGLHPGETVSVHCKFLKILNLPFGVVAALGLTFSFSAWSDPDEPYSISRKLMKESNQAYNARAAEMRDALKGKTPQKFFVDGVEYTGNYLASGEQTDVYRVVRNGKTMALRIPKDALSLMSNIDYGKLMTKAQAEGLSAVKIYSPAGIMNIGTEVEYLDGFKSYLETLQDAARDPKNPDAQKRLKLFEKVFGGESGKKIISSLNGGNVGTGIGEDGVLVAKISDMDVGETNFTKVSRYSETQHAGIMREARAYFEHLPEGETRTNGLKLVEARDAKFQKILFPDEVKNTAALTPKVKKVPVLSAKAKSPKSQFRLVPTEEAPAPKRVAPYAKQIPQNSVECRVPRGTERELAMKRTVGNVGEVMNFAGLVMAFLPESNPYADEGIFCVDAYAQRGRVKCEWDNALHPLNNYALCSVIRVVKKTGKKSYYLKKLQDEELCSVTYDSFTFRMDDEKSRETFKALDVFQRNGMQTPFKNSKSFFEDFKKKFKITEPTYRESIPYPDEGLFGSSSEA